MRFCPNCFSQTADSNISCTYCGYSANISQDGAMLPLGTMLNRGQYRTGRVLGKPGGFGITYLALDESLEVKVAIKELFPRQLLRRTGHGSMLLPYTENEGTYFKVLDQFKKESRIMAQLRHPNIVGTRAFFEENGTAYLVMEYLEGESLNDNIARTGRIHAPEAVALISPILSSLTYIHSLNLFHRDIKPSNIYLTNNGTPILLDFGSARQVLSDLSNSLSVVVTPGFAPFEQYQKRGKQGPWTDLYSYAATLYYMVTGNLPLEATERITDDTLPEPAAIVPGFSRKVSELIMWGLQMDSRQRPQDAAIYQSELLAAVAQRQPEPVVAKPIQLKQPVIKVPIVAPEKLPSVKPASIEAKVPVAPRPSTQQTKGKWLKVVAILVSLAVTGFIGGLFFGEKSITSPSTNVAQETAKPLKLPNGDSYEGEALNGVPHGTGTYVWKNGDRYRGDWLQGKRHGQGIMNWTDGREYSGLWVADHQEGKGKMTWKTGMWFDGTWRSGGMLVGTIKNVPYEGGMKMDYVGPFSGTVKEGKGTAYIYKSDGAEAFRYMGRFVNDKMKDDAAKILFPNGSSYVGAISNNKFNGRGVYTWPDGAKKAGVWENDEWISP